MLERNPQQLGDKLAQQRVPIGMRAPRFFFKLAISSSLAFLKRIKSP
jgi:hypothetical protein